MSSSSSQGALRVPMDPPPPGQPLSEMAARAAALLLKTGAKVAVFESTTAGLVSAALQSVPGASRYTTFGAVTYSRRSTAAALPGLKLNFARPETASEYRASKETWTTSVAMQALALLPEATWCVSESGACGPTFTHEGVDAGFTSICVAGPNGTRSVFVESPHADREANMRGFAKHALDLLAQCIEDAAGAQAPSAAQSEEPRACIEARSDRWGGVIASAVPGASPAAFAAELRRRVAEWRGEEKRGLWLAIPSECPSLVGSAADAGFQFHHATPGYLQMTQWLLDTPSPLPRYAFTQIGVGGVVVNDRGEVLMVKERVSPSDQYQDSWKLPGGLADPGESFADTARREVMEETGVPSELAGVASMRHSHGVRFGQSDLYVLVRLRATSSEIRIDEHEIAVAEWMSEERIIALTEHDPTKSYRDKVSATNAAMIDNALNGRLVLGKEVMSSRGPTMLYVAG